MATVDAGVHVCGVGTAGYFERKRLLAMDVIDPEHPRLVRDWGRGKENGMIVEGVHRTVLPQRDLGQRGQKGLSISHRRKKSAE